MFGMSLALKAIGYSKKGIGTGISAASVPLDKLGDGLIWVGTKCKNGAKGMDEFGQRWQAEGDFNILAADEKITAESVEQEVVAQGKEDVDTEVVKAVVKKASQATVAEQAVVKEAEQTVTEQAVAEEEEVSAEDMAAQLV